MQEYRYANNIRWGDTYSELDGMHHIFAENHQEAFNKANRADKELHGITFLQVQDENGRWRFLTRVSPNPKEDEQ